MKKITSLILSGLIIFLLVTPTQASEDDHDEPPFDAYEVSEGDVLSYIEEHYGVEFDELYNFHSDIEPSLLKVGSSISLVGNTDNSTERAILSAGDRDLLERLVQAEAGDQEYEGKVAVAEVVFNRVDSSDFPNSVYEVITQEGQFEPYETGTIHTSPDAESVESVEEALEGTNLVEGALFFWNPTIATSRWLEKLTVVKQIDNHEFLE